MSAYTPIPSHLPPFAAGLMIGAAMKLRRAGENDTADLMERTAVQLWPDARHYLPERADIDHRKQE